MRGRFLFIRTFIVVLVFAGAGCQKFEPEHRLLVNTGGVSELAYTSVTFNGLLRDVPQGEVLQHGFCWGADSLPLLESATLVEMARTAEPGEFSSLAGGMYSNSTYFVRAFASTETETVYGGVQSFTTLAGAPSGLEHVLLGGSYMDHGRCVVGAEDGGVVLAGYSNSSDGDVTNPSGDHDMWLLALDGDGEIRWQKSFGEEGEDRAHDMIRTADGGFLLCGDSWSAEEEYDARVVKFSANGDLQWDRTYGGSDYDALYSALEMSDGSYLLAGYSASSDGDVSQNQGDTDCWILKLDAQGEKMWQRSMGGSAADRAMAIVEAPGGGFVMAGQTYSSDGDVTGFSGESDLWLVRLNSSGYIQWQKALGGSAHDAAKSLIRTSEGDFVLAGISYSSGGDVPGNAGDCDYWVLRFDEQGDLAWNHSFGGSRRDDARSVSETADGGFVVAGSSYSSDGDVSGNKGGADCWIVRLDASGALLWEVSGGGEGDDHAYGVLQAPGDVYVVTGETASAGFGGLSSGIHGLTDFWVAYLRYDN